MKLARAAHLKLGRRGEAFACRLLETKGYDILARNWRIKAGELDIVARDGMMLVFVEVKTLRHAGLFRPLDNLSPRQRRRNFRAGKFYWKMLRMPGLRARFDLVEVVLGRWDLQTIRHWENYLPQLPEASRRKC